MLRGRRYIVIISFILNGKHIKCDADPCKTLLNFLRDDMRLTGTKKGCEIGECGACTVLLNKKAVSSCMVLTGQVQNSEVTTIEGVSEKILNPLKEKLIEYGAVQCGYCTPGMVMSIVGLLYENKNPDENEIKRAIDGNLCRCTGYKQIIEGVSNLHLEEICHDDKI